VYFKFAVGVPTSWAGFLVLIGQIADGLATPVVGFLSDKCTNQTTTAAGTYERFNNTEETPNGLDSTMDPSSGCSTAKRQEYRGIRNWIPTGRKAYHFGGSLLVILSFPLLFGSPIAEKQISTWIKILYYTVIAILFQIGWACVQITHLALMNDLSLDPGERTLLTSLRYLFTVLSNLGVYLCTYSFLKPTGTPPSNSTTTTTMPLTTRAPVKAVMPAAYTLHLAANPLVVSSHPWFGQTQIAAVPETEKVDFGPEQLPAFRYLSLAIIGVGFVMTLIFHLTIRRSDYVIKTYSPSPALTDSTSIRSPDLEAIGLAQATTLHIRTWRDWMHVPLFWVQGFAYMTSRLIVNVTQVYLTVYLLHSLLLSKETITLVPLTVFTVLGIYFIIY
jgi:Na+/melibiose symporter-like transporter